MAFGDYPVAVVATAVALPPLLLLAAAHPGLLEKSQVAAVPAATARPPCRLTCLGHVGSGPEPAMHQHSALETRTCRVSVCLELLASAFQPLDLLPGPSEHSRSSESASAWNLPQRAVRRRLGPHRALLQCIFGSVVGTINLRVPCAAAGAALLVCFGPPAAATPCLAARAVTVSYAFILAKI